MIKLNFYRRLLVNAIYGLGFLIMFGIPVITSIDIIYNNIEYVDGNRLQLNWAVAGVFILIILALIYVKYLRKVFHRKLIGLQVRDELGIMPVKGIMGMITDRLLRTLEYVYPFTITLVILYISKYMFSQYEVFSKLFDLNTILLYLSMAGFGILLVGDFVKMTMMKQQEVLDRLDMTAKQNKLEIRRLEKSNKRQLKALELEKELKRLKEDL